MSLGPFDLTGGPFLMLYGGLLAVTIVAGFAIPRWLRPEGRTARITDADELAVLAGGGTRFFDAVVSRLLAVKALTMIGKDRFLAETSTGRNAAERSVLTLAPPTKWSTIERALKPHVAPLERKLVAAGLLMDGGTATQLRLWQTTPYLLLFVFGAIKWEVGTMRDRPVGFLTMLLVATAIFALIRFLAVDRRTRGGQQVLAEAMARADRMRRAPTPTETDMAVALFGTAVLVGSGWAGFHTLRTSNASSGGDSGGGGSDGGGGGCGGGGCGGCGG
jgi:uncharacterized protein (TIGR04222 family)